MSNASNRLDRVLEHFDRMERLLGHLEQNQVKQHVRNSIKEGLLAYRSVIDSIVDTLEEEQETPEVEKTEPRTGSNGKSKSRKSIHNIKIDEE